MFSKVSQKSIHKLLFFIKLCDMKTKTYFSKPLVWKDKSTGRSILLAHGRLPLARYHPSQVFMNTIRMLCIMLITMVTCLAKNSSKRHKIAVVEYRAWWGRRETGRGGKYSISFFQCNAYTCIDEKSPWQLINKMAKIIQTKITENSGHENYKQSVREIRHFKDLAINMNI